MSVGMCLCGFMIDDIQEDTYSVPLYVLLKALHEIYSLRWESSGKYSTS